MPDRWKPEACPVARDQPFGYRHYHDENCRNATPAQIEADRRSQGSRRFRLANWLSRDRR